MDSITGYLIRLHRLQQHISQEGLCKGICVVSYLSKIEQGLVHPSHEIIQQLFSVLGITYSDDPKFIALCDTTMRSYMEAYFLQEDTSELDAIFEQHMDAMLLSPQVINASLYKLTKFNVDEECDIVQYETYYKQLQALSFYEDHMNDEQHFLYDLLHYYHKDTSTCLIHLERAARYRSCSTQKRYLGETLYTLGKNIEALECLHQAYQLASEEGNAKEMLLCALFLGNCYSNTHDEVLMRKYYTQSERLARCLQSNALLATIQYNIGSSYLSWDNLEQAKHYLHNATKSFDEKEHSSKLLNEQKLALLYCELDDREEMKKHLHRMDEELNDINYEIYHKMNAFVHMYCERTQLYSAQYIQTLNDLVFGFIDQNQKEVTIPYGFRIFHAKYLIEAYKNTRRYKEAMYVMECIQKGIFS